ncbi:MAG: SDR family NAD(P)-dependent oxidoreductase [Gimesia sp.]
MKAVVITGVSSGIGYDATRYLIDQGYLVFGSVRTVDDQQRLLADFPSNFHAMLFSLTDYEAIRREACRVQEILGENRLTALVNNAGIAVAGPMQLIDDDLFEQQMQVNLFGTRVVTNAFLPLMGVDSQSQQFNKQRPKNGGKIINISSISGILNTPLNGSYCVAKHAMESLGEVYRRELYMYGIDVISIQPGPIQSKIWDKNRGAMQEFYDTDYGPMIHNVETIMQEAQKDAMPAETVSKLIDQIIQSKRPKLSYIVHRKKWPIQIITKYIPARIVDYILWKKLSPR